MSSREPSSQAAALRPAAWRDGGRIPGLDGLRAIAVLLVITSHAAVTRGFPANHLAVILDKLGTIGVDVFFVLSGFLITSLLCREQERSRSISLRAFYLRRVLRIFPAYVGLLLFVAGLSLAGRADVVRGDWLAALTYTMNFRERPAWELGHVWSLSIEEHFYLLWPPLIAWLPRRTALWGLGGVLVLEPIVRTAILAWSPDLTIRTELWTFLRIDPIAAGCLLALIARSAAGVRALDVVVRFWPVAAALVIFSAVGELLSGKFGVSATPSMSTLGLTGLVWATIRRAPRWLEARPVVAIGVGSYSLYLWQELFLNPRRVDWWNLFPQNLLFVAAFAALSYRVIEQPFLRMRAHRASR